MKGFFLLSSGVVRSEQIDKNGHMNVVKYMGLFDKGTDELFDRCGISYQKMGLIMVASRIMIDHRKELLEGEAWQIWSGIIAVKSSYLTITHRLQSNGSLRAVCDIRITPVSRITRGSMSLNEATISQMRRFMVPGLADRFHQITFEEGLK